MAIYFLFINYLGKIQPRQETICHDMSLTATDYVISEIVCQLNTLIIHLYIQSIKDFPTVTWDEMLAIPLTPSKLIHEMWPIIKEYSQTYSEFTSCNHTEISVIKKLRPLFSRCSATYFKSYSFWHVTNHSDYIIYQNTSRKPPSQSSKTN